MVHSGMLLNGFEDILYFEHLVAFPLLSALKNKCFSGSSTLTSTLDCGAAIRNIPMFPRLSGWLWCTYAPKTPPRGSVQDSHSKHVIQDGKNLQCRWTGCLHPTCRGHTRGWSPPSAHAETVLGTSFILWALKVTAQTFGWAMSTFVVQECYLWPHLEDMRDAEKECLHTEMVWKWCTRK